MLALRKREGISLEDYQNRFGEDIEAAFGEYPQKMDGFGIVGTHSHTSPSHPSRAFPCKRSLCRVDVIFL